MNPAVEFGTSAPAAVQPDRVHLQRRRHSRVLDVVRLHGARAGGSLGTVWFVTACALAINVVIFALLRWGGVGEDAGVFTGGISAMLISLMVMFVVYGTQVFSYAVGLGFSRRAYLSGTALVGVAVAVSHGLAVWVLGIIERATDGWWTGTYFFRPLIVPDNEILAILTYAALLASFSMVGLFFGAVYRRWRTLGTYVVILTMTLMVGLVIVWISTSGGWPAVGRWLVQTPRVVLTAGIPAAFGVAALGASFLILRRAAP